MELVNYLSGTHLVVLPNIKGNSEIISFVAKEA